MHKREKLILFIIEHFLFNIKYGILTKLLLKFAILNLIQREKEGEFHVIIGSFSLEIRNEYSFSISAFEVRYVNQAKRIYG